MPTSSAKPRVFTARASVRVTGFDSERDADRVARYLSAAVGDALSAAVAIGSEPTSAAPAQETIR